MKPVAVRELLGRQTAELAKLGDHMRLIGVPHINCRLCPIDALATPRIHEPRLETSQSGVKLRPNSELLTELPRQMLS